MENPNCGVEANVTGHGDAGPRQFTELENHYQATR
jgi:hypothetical protein